jgi:DNA replication protein DnaC
VRLRPPPELEIATRANNALQARVRQAGFPVPKDFDTFDFTAVPSLSKPKVLELARGEWIEQRFNICLIGSPGTGKTHLATALGLAACRQGKRVRFLTAAALVTRLEEAQKQYQLNRLLAQVDRADLLICDELGDLSLGRGGAALLFRVFADRYERRGLLVTSNLPFSEWGQVFQGERMTAALLDRLTHRCHILEMNGESFRFRESMKGKRAKKAE